MLAAAAGLVAGVVKGADGKHYPISCGSLNYQEQFKAGKMDIFSFLDACRAMKLDGVDINVQRSLKSTDKAYLNEVCQQCLNHKLKVSSVLVTTEFAQSAETIPKEVETARRAMEVGVILGAPVLRVFAGTPPSPDKKEEAFSWAVDGLRKTSALGATFGMAVALQNHGGLTCSGDDMLRFHREVDHPNFFLLLDTGYFNGRDGPNGTEVRGFTYDDYYHSIEKVAPLTRLVRAKFYDVDANGREKWIDYDRVFKILRAAHYSDFISLMWEGQEDATTGVPRAARFLQSFYMT